MFKAGFTSSKLVGAVCSVVRRIVTKKSITELMCCEEMVIVKKMHKRISPDMFKEV